MTLQSFFPCVERRTQFRKNSYRTVPSFTGRKNSLFSFPISRKSKNWSNNNKLHPCHRLFCTYNPTCSYLVVSSYIKQQWHRYLNMTEQRSIPPPWWRWHGVWSCPGSRGWRPQTSWTSATAARTPGPCPALDRQSHEINIKLSKIKSVP